jgi:hypothetical protein
MRIATLVSAAAMAMAASAAHAAEVSETSEFKAPAQKVWETASPDFCGIGQWHPAVEKCAMSDGGKTRTLSLKGGGTIVEKQTSWDPSKMSYSYDIVESPLPVQNYKSTFVVAPNGDSASTITWSSTFEPKGASEDEAKKVIQGIYSGGLEALQSKM